MLRENQTSFERNSPITLSRNDLSRDINSCVFLCSCVWWCCCSALLWRHWWWRPQHSCCQHAICHGTLPTWWQKTAQSQQLCRFGPRLWRCEMSSFEWLLLCVSVCLCVRLSICQLPHPSFFPPIYAGGVEWGNCKRTSKGQRDGRNPALCCEGVCVCVYCVCNFGGSIPLVCLWVERKKERESF